MTDEETRKIFAQRLSDLLYDKHLTARDFAARIGVSEGSMTQYKKGSYLPKGYILQDIADALNVTTDYLLGYEPSRNNSGSAQPKQEQTAKSCDTSVDYELNIISRLPELSDEAKQLLSVTADALVDGNQDNQRIIKAYFDTLNRLCR